MILQIERGQDETALAEVELHERRVGQVKLAFQNGSPAAAVRLLDGRARDHAAVAPVPAVFRGSPGRALKTRLGVRRYERAHTGPIGQVARVQATEHGMIVARRERPGVQGGWRPGIPTAREAIPGSEYRSIRARRPHRPLQVER